MGKVKRPDITKATLDAMKKGGMSTRKIAKVTGLSQTAVVERLNGPPPKQKFFKPKPTKEQLEERVKWGMTQAQIGQEFGFSQSVISKEMEENNVTPNHFKSTGQHGGSNAKVYCTCHVKPGKRHKSTCDLFSRRRS